MLRPETAPPAPTSKFPQLKWELPEEPPPYSAEYRPQSAHSGVEQRHGNPASASGKLSWQLSAPPRAHADSPALKQTRTSRPQTSGAAHSAPRRAPTRSAQHHSDTGEGARAARAGGSSGKIEWALPPVLKPAQVLKGGQKLAGLLIPAARTGSKDSVDPHSPSQPPARASRPSSCGSPAARAASAASAGHSEPSQPETAKWSRLQALKQARSTAARAVLEASRPSQSSSPAASPGPPSHPPATSAASAASTPSISRTPQPKARQRLPSRASADMPELPAISSAAAKLQNERLASAAEAAPREDGQPLIACEGCSRTFIPSALERHSKICAKVFQTKRKAVDFKGARAPEAASDGTFGEAAALPKRSSAKPAGPRRASANGSAPASSAGAGPTASRPAAKGQSKWKVQSSQLRAAMAAGRGAGGDAAGSSPFAAPPEPDPSLVLCPHCGRRFNDKAAERHIPRCQDIVAKPTRLAARAGKGAHARV